KAIQGGLTVSAPATLTFGNTATLTASGGNGTGVVTFSAGTSLACSVSGSTLSVTNASGTCAVTASKAGDDNYIGPIASLGASVTLQKASQATLTLSAGSPLTDNTTETLSTSGGNGDGAVNFTLTSGPCSLSGTQLTANSGTGTCGLLATKAAD